MKISWRNPNTSTAIGLLILVWLILCKPWFWDGNTVPWDSKSAFYPSLSFVAQSLRSGEIPLWNPFVYGGYPMISDPQAMIFSPVAVLSMLAVKQPSIHWFDGIELVHVLLAGLGMLLLAVRLGRSNLAAFFAALIYMYGGPASSRMQHVPIIFAYAYFPFALLTLDHALETKRLRSALAFGVLAGAMAAHQNQVAYLFSLVLLGYAGFQVLASDSRVAFVRDRWQVFTGAAFSGALTLAVPLYFTLQFLPLSNRIQIPFDLAVSDSVHPLTLLSFFMRNFFGNARMDTFWGFGDISETFLYAGTLPVILIARYGIGNAILFGRQFRYFFCVGIFSLLYALGGYTPFYRLIYHVVPGVSLYRRPTDATFVLNMVLAVAAGILIDRLLAGDLGRIRPWAMAAGGIPVLALFIGGFSAAYQQQKFHFIIKDSLWAVMFIGVSLGLLRTIVASKFSQVRMKLVWVLLGLLVLDFGLHNAGSRMNATGDSYPLLTRNSSDPVALFLRNGLRSDRGDYRADITWAGALWANGPMVLGIQSTQGYNPLRYALYDRVVGTQEGFFEVRPFSRMMPNYDSPILDLLGVKYIVSAKPLSEVDPQANPNRFPLVFEQSGVHVWQNLNALPRVMAATSLYVQPDLMEAIESGKMAQVDFRTVVVVPHAPQSLVPFNGPAETVIALPGQGDPIVKSVDYRYNVVRIAVETERDAIIVLNDPWYPCWHVYVDGKEREILQANYLFRGVHVRSGEREVDFRFEPYSWSAVRSTLFR